MVENLRLAEELTPSEDRDSDELDIDLIPRNPDEASRKAYFEDFRQAYIRKWQKKWQN